MPLLDLTHTADVDYLSRCGLDLDQLLVVRPTAEQTMPLLLDLVNTRDLPVVLVDTLANLTANRAVARQLGSTLTKLATIARNAGLRRYLHG